MESLWSSQDLLKAGCRWRIGDGKNIRAWNEPWVRQTPSLRIQSVPIANLEHICVNQLMLHDPRVWNAGLVRSMFNDEEANSILSIPLVSSSG